MESTEGEPDVVGFDKKTGEYIFYDCAGKVRKAGEVSATIVLHWRRGNNTSQRIAPWMWLRKWE
jgi:hypothetical protein